MTGHVKLGNYWYKLNDPRAYARSNANQAAAKIAQGVGSYSDLLNWSAFLMDNWQAGSGKKDPAAGGSLYATLDTRFQNQLLLPSLLRHLSATDGDNDYSANIVYENLYENISAAPSGGEFTVGYGYHVGSRNPQGMATRIDIDDNNLPTAFEFLLPGATPDVPTVSASLTTSVADAPGLEIDSQVIVLTDRVGYFWYTVNFDWSSYTPTGGPVSLYVTIFPNGGTVASPTAAGGTLAIPVGNYASSGNYVYDGQFGGSESWISNYNTQGIFVRWHTDLGAVATPALPAAISHIISFNGHIYFSIDKYLYKYNATTRAITEVSTEAATITDLMSTGDTLYIALGSGNVYRKMTTAESFSSGVAGAYANRWLLWRGYLYRSVGANVYVTSDEVTWELIDVADSGYQVRGLGGQGDYVIAVSDNAMYRIGWGNQVQQLSSLEGVSASNGAHMINYQGDLYISMGESLFRFDGQAMLPVGLDLGEGLPSFFHGDIAGLTHNNTWLLALVVGETSSAWIFNGQGWHFATELPQGVDASCLTYFDSDGEGFSRFVIGTSVNQLYSFQVPETYQSVRLHTAVHTDHAHYHPTGWLETDWFFGDLFEVEKDPESFFAAGVDLAERVQFYWTTDGTTWNLLGTMAADADEIRFTWYTTRPIFTKMKLAVLLKSNFGIQTPSVQAVRFKYRGYIDDTWRWQVPLEIKSFQEMPDGTLSHRETADMIAELDDATRQIKPLHFIDLDRAEYDVMILNSTRQPLTEPTWITIDGESFFDVQWLYSLTLEQIAPVADGDIGIANPSDISDLWGWWDMSDVDTVFQDAGATTVVAADDDPVLTVLDKSGNDRHLVKHAADATPSYSLGVADELGGVYFAADEVLYVADQPLLAAPYDWPTFFAIIKTGAAGTDVRGVLSNWEASAGEGQYVYTEGTDIKAATDNVGVLGDLDVITGPGFAANTVYSICHNPYNSGVRSLHVNDQQTNAVETALANTVCDFFSVGQIDLADITHGLAGHILEVAVFERGLTDDEMNALAEYAAQKWGAQSLG